MSAIASEITSFTNVNPTVYSDADQRKHQSSASLAFLRGDQWIPHTKVQWRGKCSHLMTSACVTVHGCISIVDISTIYVLNCLGKSKCNIPRQWKSNGSRDTFSFRTGVRYPVECCSESTRGRHFSKCRIIICLLCKQNTVAAGAMPTEGPMVST